MSYAGGNRSRYILRISDGRSYEINTNPFKQYIDLIVILMGCFRINLVSISACLVSLKVSATKLGMPTLE